MLSLNHVAPGFPGPFLTTVELRFGTVGHQDGKFEIQVAQQQQQLQPSRAREGIVEQVLGRWSSCSGKITDLCYSGKLPMTIMQF